MLPKRIDPVLRQRAASRGYANRFEAIRAHVPWRPLLIDEWGARVHPKPTVAGPLLARVVGPDGSTEPAGAQEIHMDHQPPSTPGVFFIFFVCLVVFVFLQCPHEFHAPHPGVAASHCAA